MIKKPIVVDQTTALGRPREYAFVPGKGYIFRGLPNPVLPRPGVALPSADACEPPAPASDGTFHMLTPPDGSEPMKFRWEDSTRDWFAQTGKGNRLAFSSKYLAEAGWTYLGSIL